MSPRCVPSYGNDTSTTSGPGTRIESAVSVTLCPLSELGFLRISTQPIYGATFPEAKRMLRDWKQARKPGFIPCDLEALAMDDPPTGTRTTDFYLVQRHERPERQRPHRLAISTPTPLMLRLCHQKLPHS